MAEYHSRKDRHRGLLDSLKRSSSKEWRGYRDTLISAASSHQAPKRVFGYSRTAMVRQLILLMQWLDKQLVSPKVEDEDLFGRKITVFHYVQFRIDYHERSISTCLSMADTIYYRCHSLELQRPLSNADWLESVLYQPGIDWRMLRYACSLNPDCQGSLKHWLIESAYALLREDPRFQLLGFELHNVMNLDPQILKWTLQSHLTGQMGCRAEHYNFIWRNYQRIRQVVDLDRKMLPVIVTFLAEEPNSDTRRSLFGVFRDYLCNELDFEPAVWRYLCKYGADLFTVPWSMCGAAPLIAVAASFLRFLVDADLPPLPPEPVLQALLHIYGDEVDYINRRSHIPRDIVRILFIEAHKWDNKEDHTAFLQEFLLICYWAEVVRPKLDKSQRRRGWPLLLRRSRDWQYQQMIRAKAGNVSWTCPRLNIPLCKWEVVPLENAAELVEEGFAMRHCAGRYVGNCQSNKQRFFSIRCLDTEKRIATLSIKWMFNSGWQIQDAKGFANRPVSDEIRELGKQIAELYTLDPDGVREESVAA